MKDRSVAEGYSLNRAADELYFVLLMIAGFTADGEAPENRAHGLLLG